MPEAIVFVGTSHLDRLGRRRLASFLDILMPDTIAVELDNKRTLKLEDWMRDTRAKELSMLKEYPGSDPATVKWVVENYAYEYREALNYCGRSRAVLSCVDDALEDNPMSASTDTARLLAMPLHELHRIGNSMYTTKKQFNPSILPWLQAREDIMEMKMRELRGRVCFIGGAGHVFSYYGNLYDRFADSDVARYSLNMVGSPNWMKRVERALPIKW